MAGFFRRRTMRKTWIPRRQFLARLKFSRTRRSSRGGAMGKRGVDIQTPIGLNPSSCLTNFRNNPFPPHTFFDITWAGGNFFAATSNVTGVVNSGNQVYRLNSIFAPNFSTAADNTNSYTAFYSKLSAIYFKYIVYAVSVHIEFLQPSTPGVSGVAIVQASSDTADLAGFSLWQNVLSAPNCMNAVPLMSVGTGASGSTSHMITRKIWLHNLEGITQAQYAAQESIYGASFGASPSATPWLRVGCIDQLKGGGGMNFRVTLTFHGKAYERFNEAT